MQLTKIISGGQTGADQGGLEAGKILGLQTSGTAPKGFKTEMGKDWRLGVNYGLVESSYINYPPRTRQNVQDSDGTVIFGNIDSPGSKLTLRLCKELNKPYCLLGTGNITIEVDKAKDDLLTWLGIWDIKVLNVAGNRESTNPGIQNAVRDFLVNTLKKS